MVLKNLFYKTIAVSSLAVFIVSCKPTIDVPAPSKGNLNLSTYVAVGNSLTAGYTDNALYNEGQKSSYPSLIAQQFMIVGGGKFTQPLVPSTSVGMGFSQNSRFMLAPVTNCKGSKSLAPVALQGDMGVFTNSVAASGPFNNMGVPGAKSITIIYPGYGNPGNGRGNYNPYYTRMSVVPSSTSILGDAAAQQPTFFSLSVGADDVLPYAVTGGDADFITPSAGAPGSGFDASVDLIVNTLSANGTKGVIANVPDVTAMPFFTTIPYNGLVLDQNSAAALTTAYSQLGIQFHAGNNAFVIEDSNSPGGLRQIREGEFILLSTPQDSLTCGGWGSMKPINGDFVLTADEVANVRNAITAYNTKLKAVADAKGLAFVDVYSFLKTVKTGIMYNGIGVNAQFVSGGAFSLDGVHLTPLGNALLANEFIKAINAKYGSNIPRIDATKFRGVIFPG